MINEIYRQGDLLIVKTGKFEETGLKPASKILALGETTGHKHELHGSCEVFDDVQKGVKFVKVGKGQIQLQHEEHKTITLTKGNYMIVRQRELNLLGEVQKVAD